jgi:pyruvate kinase
MTGKPFPATARPSQTKIVATVGPACEGVEKLAALIEAGVDVFRVNTAHGDRQQHARWVEDIRAAGRRTGRVVAVLVDLAGPKIRLGELPGGQLELETGDAVRFVRGDEAGGPGRLTTTYDRLVDELEPGDRVVVADGMVALSVERIEDDAAVCRVAQGGLIRTRQGVNLPGVKLSVPTLGEQDRANAEWAAENGVDFIGLSFVRTAADLRQLAALVTEAGSEAQTVAKIEKPEALENLDEIIEAADAVMIARGDLGVEIDIADVPVVQKRIISACHQHRRPVIVATQMLDSMQQRRIPTRAEATDVANAILDGADACMLSGETAIGRYPREAVETMHRIALATEPLGLKQSPGPPPDFDAEGVNPITEAVTYAAGRIAEELGAKTLVVASASGRTALAVSKNRHFVPTLGVSDSEATLRRMCLYWGVIPLPDAPAGEGDELLRYVVERGRAAGHFVSGDRIVLVSGTGLSSTRHNAVVVHEID